MRLDPARNAGLGPRGHAGRRHGPSQIGLLCAFLVLVWGAWWVVAEWRFQSGLKRARADLSARRFGPARQWLLTTGPQRRADGEIDFLLGLCEEELKRPEKAEASYARVPPSSRFGTTAVRARAQLLVRDLGRFSEAEKALIEALARQPGASELVYQLSQIYFWEGRKDEMRRLLQERWGRSTDHAGDLHDLWRIDMAALKFEEIQAAVEHAARQAPEDDRVWLAQARLATDAGRFSEAARRLEDCTKRRPEDAAVWRARLRLARAAGSADDARAALKHLTSDRFTELEALSLRAWFAEQEGRADDERAALEQLVERAPGDTRALDRLAVLAARAGRPDRAAEWRRRKAQMDRLIERYYRILDAPGPITRFAELAGLAEALGRGFEARGWWQLAARQRPGDSDAAAAVARLGPPRPEERSLVGRALADVLGAAPRGMGPSNARAARGGPSARPASTRSTSFRDDADAAGLRFVFDNGRSPRRQLPETTAGGVGLLDYDHDGWLDVYLVQGGVFPPDPMRPSTGDRLFHNRGDGTFEDASGPSGIANLSRGFGHGVTVGDFDNDGWPDLFLTRWRAYALFRNRGDGTFEDVTERVGLGGERDWPTSAAFADLDNDGDLDLYVCHYLVWDADHPVLCPRPPKPDEGDGPGPHYDYCMPNPFPARPDHLFRNDGGHFTDVTGQAGIVDRNGRGLGVTAVDVDDDGLLDLFVANDTTANYFWHNLGGMKFEESGVISGVACNASGAFQAGMGTAVGDIDGDGLPDLFVTNFYGESATFFRNLGAGTFSDQTAAIGLAGPSRYLLGFGVAAFEANNDGRLDLAITNGHVVDMRPEIPVEMPCLLMLGGPGGRLVDASASAGAPWSVPRLGRGLAVGDLDNDGRTDVLVLAQNGPLGYFHNQTKEGRFLALRLEGARSNRDAVGAVVTINAAGRRQRAWRYGGGSFQSASSPLIHFGLEAERVDQVEVRWPSGRVERFGPIEADRGVLLREGTARPEPLAGFGLERSAG